MTAAPRRLPDDGHPARPALEESAMTSTVPTSRITVRRAGPADATGVTAALAAAFHDDPVFTWLLPEEDTRAVATRELFALVVAELAWHDETWTTSEGTTGAAVWVPPGRPAVAEERAEAFGAQMAGIWGAAVERAGALVELMEEHHPAAPHEYLWFLGVVPAAQGCGYGSALMAPVLERADRTATPAYLEATSPRSRDLYARHGFRAAPAIAVPGGPPLWPMWREPDRSPARLTQSA